MKLSDLQNFDWAQLTLLDTLALVILGAITLSLLYGSIRLLLTLLD
jgi:hypothetical protein